MVQPPHAGPGWSELAKLDPLAAVLDPADAVGTKNRAIDAAHVHALSRALKDARGLRALDFGCGTGRLSAWLLGQGAHVDGVDATQEMVEVARRRVPGANFFVSGEGPLPVNDSSYDLVVTAYVLQYYVVRADDLACILADFRRVLAPGGRVLAVEQVAENDIGRGGLALTYQEAFTAAGFAVEAPYPFRLGRSRVLRLATHLPAFATTRFLTAVLKWEAQRGVNAELRSGSYADYLFVARSTSSP